MSSCSIAIICYRLCTRTGFWSYLLGPGAIVGLNFIFERYIERYVEDIDEFDLHYNSLILGMLWG